MCFISQQALAGQVERLVIVKEWKTNDLLDYWVVTEVEQPHPYAHQTLPSTGSEPLLTIDGRVAGPPVACRVLCTTCKLSPWNPFHVMVWQQAGFPTATGE